MQVWQQIVFLPSENAIRKGNIFWKKKKKKEMEKKGKVTSTFL